MFDTGVLFRRMPLFTRKYITTTIVFLLLLLTMPMVIALPVGGIVNIKPHVDVRGEKAKGWTVAGERYALAYGDYIRTDKTGKAECTLQ